VVRKVRYTEAGQTLDVFPAEGIWIPVGPVKGGVMGLYKGGHCFIAANNLSTWALRFLDKSKSSPHLRTPR
jgi:hypothetical protein